MPSSTTSPAPSAGTPDCSSARAPASGGNAVHILSAGTVAFAAVGLAVSVPALDFLTGVYDSREGPWECWLPEAPARERTVIPSRALVSIRFSAKPRFHRKSARTHRWFGISFSTLCGRGRSVLPRLSPSGIPERNAGASSIRGELAMISFSLTSWLPVWVSAPGNHSLPPPYGAVAPSWRCHFGPFARRHRHPAASL